LPQPHIAGPKPINVVISDTLGTPRTFGPFPLIYDPIPPVLNGGNVSGDSNTKTIIRTLTFSGVNVSDNLYDPDANNADDFWGVWVANADLTATPNITPGSPGLIWTPVQVASPGASFSIQWSLFTGLSYGPRLDKPGTYRVF